MTTPLHEKLTTLLQGLSERDQLEFQALIDAVYRVRFTGPLTIDFRNGVPQQVNVGPPVRLTICRGTVNGLDRPPTSDPP